MSAKALRRGAKSTQQTERSLDLRALQRTPGFMLRLAQLKFFEGFYEEFAVLGLTPATYAIFVVIRDNPGVPPSSLAGLLRLRLPNLIKILNEARIVRFHQAQPLEVRSPRRRVSC